MRQTLNQQSPEQKRAKRDSHLRRTYGITLANYEALLEAQDFACAICRKPSEAEGRALAVDHDHISGRIRGLLCSYCNLRRIGKHRDSEMLIRMAEYVSQGTDFYVPPKPKRKKKK